MKINSKHEIPPHPFPLPLRGRGCHILFPLPFGERVQGEGSFGFRIFTFLLFVFTFYLSPFTISYAETLDRVIAIVNDETITQGELDTALKAIVDRLRERFKGDELVREAEAARKEILNRMVEEKLVLSEARRQNIEVSEQELEEKLKEIRSRFDSAQSFDEAVKEGGVSLGELRQRYIEQLMVANLVELEVRKRISIAPTEVLEYYNAHKEEFKEPERVRLKNILIKPEGGLSDTDARLLAEKVLGFLKAGGDFGELALKYSKGPNADIGGDLGFVKKGQMLKEIDDVVFGLEAGGASDVVKTQLGYHIFKVEEKHPEMAMELNEVKDQIQKILFSEKLKDRYNKWIEELKKNAYISFR